MRGHHQETRSLWIDGRKIQSLFLSLTRERTGQWEILTLSSMAVGVAEIPCQQCYWCHNHNQIGLQPWRQCFKKISLWET